MMIADVALALGSCSLASANSDSRVVPDSCVLDWRSCSA
jgi:hypothetical protein